MSQLEDLIRDALRQHEGAPPDEPGLTDRIVELFLRRSRWVGLFAWTKMAGTLAVSAIATVAFFATSSTQAQIAWATLFLSGFMGFAMWWIWYWMVLGRNATLRELKRIELELAELRAAR